MTMTHYIIVLKHTLVNDVKFFNNSVTVNCLCDEWQYPKSPQYLLMLAKLAQSMTEISHDF